MHTLLLELRDAVEQAGGALPPDQSRRWRTRYRKLLGHGDTECPAPVPDGTAPRRGRVKRSKTRTRLERSAVYARTCSLLRRTKLSLQRQLRQHPVVTGQLFC
jgi:transposase